MGMPQGLGVIDLMLGGHGIERAHDELGIRGVLLFPSGCNPAVPIYAEPAS
jgi:hypothetical protein